MRAFRYRYVAAIAAAALAFASHQAVSDATCAEPWIDLPQTSDSTTLSIDLALGPQPWSGTSIIADGTTLAVRDNADLTKGSSVTLASAAKNTPLPVELGDGSIAAFIGREDGVVQRVNFDPATGAPTITGITANLARTGCPDTIAAAPTVHVANYGASEAFKAAYPDRDLVYVATSYVSDGSPGCAGDETTNRIYALDASDLTTVWIFNELGAASVNVFPQGGFLDYDNDRLYIGTASNDASQHSLWSIDVTTGTAAWSYPAGSVLAPPAMRDGVVYASTSAGEIHALAATDGAPRWSASNGGITTTNLYAEFRAPYDDMVAVSDLIGRVWLVRDDVTAGTTEWTATLPAPARSGVAIDHNSGKMYVGALGGELYQLSMVDGSVEASREVDTDPASAVGDPSFVFTDATFTDVVLVAGSDTGDLAAFCFPWTPEVSPVAPEGDGPPVFAPAPPRPCEVAADCGTGTRCAPWMCVNQVCVPNVAATNGATCEDGNDRTGIPGPGFPDRCKGGICSGLSDCQVNYGTCQCTDDKGFSVNRFLLTAGAATRLELPEADLVQVQASNTCIPMVDPPPDPRLPGASQSILWIHLFDQNRIPINDVDSFTITMTPASGDLPVWVNPLDPADKRESFEVTLASGFVKEADSRPGTYYAILESQRADGTPSDRFEGHQFDLDIQKSTGGHKCVDTAGLVKEAQIKIRMGTTSLTDPPESQCRFLGDVNESNTLVLQIEGAGFQAKLGWDRDGVEMFFSNYEEFIGGAGPDVPNLRSDRDDGLEDGIIVFHDVGNNLNGSSPSREEFGGTFPVTLICPRTGERRVIFPTTSYHNERSFSCAP